FVPGSQRRKKSLVRFLKYGIFIIRAEALSIAGVVPGTGPVHFLIQPFGNVHMALIGRRILDYPENQQYIVCFPLFKAAALFKCSELINSLFWFQMIPVNRHISERNPGILPMVFSPYGKAL